MAMSHEGHQALVTGSQYSSVLPSPSLQRKLDREDVQVPVYTYAPARGDLGGHVRVPMTASLSPLHQCTLPCALHRFPCPELVTDDHFYEPLASLERDPWRTGFIFVHWFQELSLHIVGFQ